MKTEADDEAPWSSLTHSSAGWSSVEDHPSTDARDADSAKLEGRYEWLDELGAGGVGAVHLVHDTSLGRDVAYKRLRLAVPDRRRAQLLSWEAWVTARLEHPTIVPIYDAGRAKDGHAYYTMRIVRGRSLSVALEDQSTAELVRTVATVCRGVAFAHSRHVVHRDLKPANIMVGAFGEVQIVDWGLAGLSEEVAEIEVPAMGIVGTDGYASPEQLEGAAASPLMDVFALGRIVQRIAERDGAPALLAIAERASAAEATERYPSALALAEELDRFLDGRAVDAHRDSFREALGRFVRRHRAKLAVMGAALLAGLAGVGASYTRLLAERERAVVAEGTAREAEDAARVELARANRALASALEGQAVRALLQGATPEAETLAAEALLRGNARRARGVLAAAYAGARVRAEIQTLEGDCEHLVRDAATDVCLDEGVRVVRANGERWHVPFEARGALIARERILLLGAEHVSVRDLATGDELGRMQADYEPRSLLASPDGRRTGAWFLTRALFRDEHGHEVDAHPCASDTMNTLALGDRHLAAVCGDVLRIKDTGHGWSEDIALPFGRSELPAFSMAFSPDDERIAIGNVGGLMLVVDRRSAAVGAVHAIATRPIARMRFLDANKVLAIPDDGVPRVVDLRTPGLALRLPGQTGADYALEGDTLTTHLGGRAWRWTLPDAIRPAQFSTDAGLAGAAFAPNGDWVALARGDGLVSVRSMTTGEQLADVRIGTAVVKGVHATNTQIYAALAEERGAATIDVGSWHVERDARLGPIRRVGATDNAIVWIGYYETFSLYEGERFRSLPMLPAFDLAARSHDVLILDRAGRISSHDLQGASSTIARVPFARVVCAHDDAIGVALGTAFEVHEGDIWHQRVHAEVDAMTFTQDGSHVVLGFRDGTTSIWSRAQREEVMRIEGAQDRISWLGFSAEGLLATASWDRTLRLYDLRALHASGEAARQEAHETWGLRTEDVLRGTGIAR